MNKAEREAELVKQYQEAITLVDKYWILVGECAESLDKAEQNYHRAIKLRDDIHETLVKGEF